MINVLIMLGLKHCSYKVCELLCSHNAWLPTSTEHERVSYRETLLSSTIYRKMLHWKICLTFNLINAFFWKIPGTWLLTLSCHISRSWRNKTVCFYKWNGGKEGAYQSGYLGHHWKYLIQLWCPDFFLKHKDFYWYPSKTQVRVLADVLQWSVARSGFGVSHANLDFELNARFVVCEDTKREWEKKSCGWRKRKRTPAEDTICMFITTGPQFHHEQGHLVTSGVSSASELTHTPAKFLSLIRMLALCLLYPWLIFMQHLSFQHHWQRGHPSLQTLPC